MTEATLSPRYLARIGDPETSHRAAAAVKDFAPQHHRQILQVLTLHPAGLTVYEIASLCCIDAHAVGKRMKELKTGGQVEVVEDLTGEVKRPTPSGRSARVWRRLVLHVVGTAVCCRSQPCARPGKGPCDMPAGTKGGAL